ncbi:MAG TPA: acyltransferase family protein [Solirubrobacterales bacterium]
MVWRGGFRPDIEGLRAIAVGCVLLAHGGVALAAGGFVGVDIFYVISGFLITGLLMREVEKRGTVNLLGFYARRARRLLPAATLVIGVTVILALLLLPPARQLTVSGDAIASSLYFSNWRFTAQAADYFAPFSETSPLQHYWSLAVEEQFYLAWPLLMLVGALLLGRLTGARRRAVLAVAVAVTAASFAYSVAYTQEAPSQAYFSTLTRAWELGVGAILALVALPVVGRRIAAALAGLGLGMVGLATVLYSGTTPYPGVAALLPVLGTAAVLVAGASGQIAGPLRALTSRPVRYLGRISYSTYLWHWPVLIFAAEIWGPLSPLQAGIAIAAAVALAAATYHAVERPFMRSRRLRVAPRRSLALGAGCAVAGVIAALVLVRAQPEIDVLDADDVKGAAALSYQTEPQREARALRPNPLEASKDRGRLTDDGCLVGREAVESPECAYGPDDPAATVALFGDSHAAHFFPALERLGEREDWRIVGLTKMGCTPADVTVWNGRLGAPYTECDEWREHALRRIDKEKPDMTIVSTASFYTVVEGGERLEEGSAEAREDGLVRTLKRLTESSGEVVVIGDVPHAPFEVSECVTENLDSLDECAFDIDDRRNTDGFDRRAARRVDGVKLVEVTDVLCAKGTCRAVIGDAVTYRGSNHLTATFSRTLAPVLREKLPDLD